MAERNAARQAEVLRRVLESDRVDLHTCLPGSVRSFDPRTQTAEIELGIRRVIPVGDETQEDQVEEYPILPSVPVLFPRGAGGYLLFGLSQGDHVLVLFAESDLGQWRATGEVSDPGVATRHGLSGAIAIPGIHWRGNPNPRGQSMETPRLVLGREDGPSIEIAESFVQVHDGALHVGSGEAVAIASRVQAQLDALAADLALVNAAIPTGISVPDLTLTYDTVKAASPIESSNLTAET